jgi:preprotein translocase subunit SecA
MKLLGRSSRARLSGDRRVSEVVRRCTELTADGVDVLAVVEADRAALVLEPDHYQAMHSLVAAACIAAERELRQVPRPNQVAAALAMIEGGVVELPTGEGKTLAAALATAVLAARDGAVHVLTVNDYLAARDAAWMGPLYRALGMSVSSIQAGDSLAVRQASYGSDVTYATHVQVGFDHLRDGLVQADDEIRIRRYEAVIVDEVDSVLVDEARLPLVVSGVGPPGTDYTCAATQVVEDLLPSRDFVVEQARNRVWLTDAGVDRVMVAFGAELYSDEGADVLRHVHNALRARALYRRDRHYIVRDEQVALVDPYTGRTVPGRRWSDGLHQAIEAKERLPLTEPRVVLAQMSTGDLVGLYRHVAGMTATATEVQREMKEVYGLTTVVIPAHRPSVRVDHPDQCFEDPREKVAAVLREIRSRAARWQPLLVVCTTVEDCEEWSARLSQECIDHETLHAGDHALEAEVLSRAGAPGAVTLSTHLTGRGVDIPLDSKTGSAESARGLCVIGTERFESARIERQLRGRAGRQGDPGESQFFCCVIDTSVRTWVPPSGRLAAASRLNIAQRNLDEWTRALRADFRSFNTVFSRHRLAARELRRELLDAGANLGPFDEAWMNHINSLFTLLDGIHFRAWGAEAPLAAFHIGAAQIWKEFASATKTSHEVHQPPAIDSRRSPWTVELGPRRPELEVDDAGRPPTSNSVAGHQPSFGAGMLLDVIAVVDVDGGSDDAGRSASGGGSTSTLSLLDDHREP